MAYELRCRFNHPTRKVYKDDHDGAGKGHAIK
jgi:hypothetical protein